MSDIEIAGAMRELALGEVGAQEAKSLLAELAGRSSELLARKAYPALQEVAWRMVRAHVMPEDVEDWISVYRYCERLMDKHDLTHSARQVEALGDMVARTARYADLQPADAILSRRHVVPLLEKLRDAGGRLARKDLKRHLSVEEANLSRLIALLEAGGLVVRTATGRESMIELTPEGRRSVPESSAAEDIFGAVGLQFKDVTGVAVSVTDEKGVWVATPGFEECVGLPVSAAVALVPETDAQAWSDVETAEHRWARCVRLPERDGRKTVFWIDVTDLKATADRASETISHLKAELANVRANREVILARQAKQKAFEGALMRKMEARISGAKRSAALARSRQSSLPQHDDLFHELTEIQDVVLKSPPFGNSDDLAEPTKARTVFNVMVKWANYFADNELKTTASDLPAELEISPEPVLNTFRDCTAHGLRFSELNVSRKDDSVVFGGVVVGTYPGLNWDADLMGCESEPSIPGLHVHRSNVNGSCLVEIVAPISGNPMRKIA